MKSSLLLASLGLLTALHAQGAIYGSDNRLLIGPNSPARELQRSVAIGVISSMQETKADGTVDLLTEVLDGKVCSTERFAKQPTLQFSCTGFLIGPDLLLTAGHCGANVGVNEHDTDTFCPLYSWLFDYAPNLDGKAQDKGIDPSRFYQCKEVIYAVSEENAPWRDFAIIRLNRSVEGRTPFKLASEAPKKSEPLSMIGHPMGMPAIGVSNGRVLLNNPARDIMITNLDSFGGNSGSPVMNSKKEVVGILVGGFPSAEHLTDTKRSCEIMNRCDDNGLNCLMPDTDLSKFPDYQATGAQVQKIEGVKKILEQIK